MIDRFDVARFEDALSEGGSLPFEDAGMVNGERVYQVYGESGFARTVVRSSIDATGYAAESGDDSIRLWLEIIDEAGEWHGVKKLDAYTTRVNGWERRMHDKLRELLAFADAVKRPLPICEKCKRAQKFWITANGGNKGRPASKCFSCGNGFTWMDKPKAGEPDRGKELSQLPKSVPIAGEIEDSSNLFEQLESLAKAEFQKKAAVTDRRPSEQQKAAIEAPIDVPVRVLASAGSGKCLGLGTPVLMFDGRTIAVEEIRVGDRLMGPDSKPRTVLSLARGKDEMYRISPVKGESWTCNGAHILSLMISGVNKRVEMTVNDYLNYTSKDKRYMKLHRTGVDFQSRETPLDPYLLGVWLGGGSKHNFSITTPDKEIVASIRNFADKNGYKVSVNDSSGTRCPNYNITGDALKILRTMNLLNNKNIPDAYLYNDREVRRQILAGLLDTDGYYNGGFEIMQKNPAMAHGILYLARSLGLAAYTVDKVVNGETYYRISISGKLDDLPLRITRKKAKARRQVKNVLHTGFSIEPLGLGEYYGFQIDGDGLFLLGDFTITHNTFVIERRYKHLLEHGFKPDDIVVVTFTKNMSKDMANRIIAMNPEVAGTIGETQICTIHAFCNRVLKSEGKARNIPQKSYEVKRLLQQIGKELWPYPDDADISVARPSWEEILSAIGNAKHRALRPGKDEKWYSEMWGGYHGERLAKARVRFDSVMRANKEWTFQDMLYDMEMALNDDVDFCDRVQNRFKYLMIDEGQDTNGQAMRILSRVIEKHHRLFIVGDPDQLLFRFTGATPEENLYDGFTERYPDGRMYFLETNYRSSNTIVDGSNRLIANNYETMGGPYAEIFRKECRAKEGAPDGEKIRYAMCEDPHEEGMNTAETIKELLANGRLPGDIFVASRTRAHLGYLEGPLTIAGVPFINITGGSFWQLRHVAIVLSYMRLALDNGDEDSLRRIYNIASIHMRDRYGEYSPTRWLGNSFLRAIDGPYSQEKATDAMYRYNGWSDGIKDLVWTMRNVEKSVGESTIAETVRWIIDNVLGRYLKVEEGIQDGDEDVGKLADLETVFQVADLHGKDYEKFFARVDAAIKVAEDSKNKNWDEYVVLSTAHRLKGMERPVMFGVGWSEGWDEENERVYGLLPHTFSLTEPPQNGVLNFGGQGKIEDERCIAYVIITRAKEEVFLSGFRFNKKSIWRPSRFIAELNL